MADGSRSENAAKQLEVQVMAVADSRGESAAKQLEVQMMTAAGSRSESAARQLEGQVMMGRSVWVVEWIFCQKRE